MAKEPVTGFLIGHGWGSPFSVAIEKRTKGSSPRTDRAMKTLINLALIRIDHPRLKEVDEVPGLRPGDPSPYQRTPEEAADLKIARARGLRIERPVKRCAKSKP